MIKPLKPDRDYVLFVTHLQTRGLERERGRCALNGVRTPFKFCNRSCAREMASGSLDPVVKYVTGKVSKVRWKPVPSGFIGSSDVFVSGSWDEEV